MYIDKFAVLYLTATHSHFLLATRSCSGTPLQCFQITDPASCSRAPGCVWDIIIPPSPIPPLPVPAPTPPPTFMIEEDGDCVGTTPVTRCAQLFRDFSYDECIGLPPSVSRQCSRLCTHPGCACDLDSGVCSIFSPKSILGRLR